MEFYLRFPEGMPKGTAQHKGECIRYKISGGKRVPYIHHYKKAEIDTARALFMYQLKKYRRKQRIKGPVALTIILYFDIKGPKKVWGTPKTTRPDCDNYAKELIDCMTDLGFWEDDAQICDLRIKKYYAESATIYIRIEDIDETI